MTVPALRRLLGRFERTVTKNAEQRGKYSDDPTKFIDSESDLDTMLKQFLPLTQNPVLYYPELVNTGTVGILANLLSHENTDIAVDVVEVLQELTDEDVGNDEADLDDEEEGAAETSTGTRLALAQFVDVLVSLLTILRLWLTVISSRIRSSSSSSPT
jgi:beta-catenin-like protein 1